MTSAFNDRCISCLPSLYWCGESLGARLGRLVVAMVGLLGIIVVVDGLEFVDVVECCVACEEWCVVCFGDGGDEGVEVGDCVSVLFEALFVFGEDLCGLCRGLVNVVL